MFAVRSSLRDRPLPADCAVFGEPGLADEIRSVQGGPERLREAAKRGFECAIVPRANVPKTVATIVARGVSRLADALGPLT